MIDKPTADDRFWSKVRKPDVNGCWLWMGTQQKGYGRFGANGAMILAHRHAYKSLVGPIPKGLELDHLCRVRGCVNPSHLEPVTRLVNVRRGAGHGSEKACPSGHPYDEENTMHRGDGSRVCRTCNRERCRRYRRGERT